MRRGRILMLSDYVGSGSAATGGAGIATIASYRALAGAGVDVRLVAGFAGDGLPDDAGDGVRLLGGRDLRAGSTRDALRIVYNRRARAALEPVLAAEDPEATIVILNQWTRYLTPAAIGLLGRFPLMVYMHDYFWACPNGAYFDFRLGVPCWRRPMGGACIAADCDRQGRAHKLVRLARHLTLAVERRGARRGRLLLHISRLAGRTAASLLPDERHALLYNPATLPAEPGHVGTPRHDIGYVGRLEPEKGVAALIDAAVAQRRTMLFVGEGSLAARIDATPGATRLAWQPHDAMPDLMGRCRVMTLPSLWPETWGLVTAEAMAAGVPVLVSSRAGSSELVERFGGGMAFDPGVAGDLDRGLAALLDAPGGPAGLEAGAAADMRTMLSPSRHAERIVALAAEHLRIAL